MFEHEARIFAFQKGYLRALAAELVDSQLDLVPAMGIKPPRWILGHINLGNDYILSQLGLETTCPESWHRAFGPGTDAFASPEITPSKQEFLDAFDASSALVLDAVPSAKAEHMATRHELPMALLRRGLPTRGDLVAHLLTSHLALHLGQLSTWRRAVGHPAIF